MNLLDRFTPSTAAFRPKTSNELFALRLAHKLGDGPAVAHYVSLVSSHTDFQLLLAFRRTSRNSGNGYRGKLFLSELRRTNPNGSHNGAARLIAIRIERRA